ncbi:MAG: hypothetical protein KJN87_03750, partial [Desulfofustis sp.]|nr:hypothetical protein [Desulfofustis sp.]
LSTWRLVWQSLNMTHVPMVNLAYYVVSLKNAIKRAGSYALILLNQEICTTINGFKMIAITGGRIILIGLICANVKISFFYAIVSVNLKREIFP